MLSAIKQICVLQFGSYLAGQGFPLGHNLTDIHAANYTFFDSQVSHTMLQLICSLYLAHASALKAVRHSVLMRDWLMIVQRGKARAATTSNRTHQRRSAAEH